MGDPKSTPLRVSRRALLTAGVAGAAALLFARWLNSPLETRGGGAADNALDAAARGVVAAIIPVFLRGALPDGPEASSAAAECVAGIERAIAGLSPATRKEVAELFSLLVFPPTRCLIAGVWSPWPEATPEAVESFLARWRESPFTLFRSGYAALHQLVISAWYANPRAWPAIGYPGPPSLGGG